MLHYIPEKFMLKSYLNTEINKMQFLKLVIFPKKYTNCKTTLRTIPNVPI